MRVTKKHVLREFAKCEEAFEYCWQVLADMKSLRAKKDGFAARLIAFQETLATCLFDLQALRDHLTTEERTLIGQKGKYRFEWFKSRMLLLSQYKTGIDKVNNIGKSLGDAFAYLFYATQSELLDRHLAHDPISNFSSRAGGSGELKFLANVRQLEGCFTLYHGVTHMLRIGDFSFFDMKTRQINKIGELKSSPTVLELTIIERSKEKITTTPLLPVKPLKPRDKYTDRLQRQIQSMVRLLTESSPHNSASEMPALFHYEEIEKEFAKTKCNNVHSFKASRGLAFSIVGYPKSSLFTKIFLRKNAAVTKKINDGGLALANSILKDGSINNSIIIGQVLYDDKCIHQMMRGTVPLFWCMNDITLLKALYFRDIEILSLFNSAFIMEEAEELGFSFESKYNYKRQINKQPRQQIENFDLFISYINTFLYSESFVINLLKQSIKWHEEHPNTRIAVRHNLRV